MSRVLTIGFADQEITVDIHPKAERGIAPVLDFVQPHYRLAPATATRTASLPMQLSPLSAWRRPPGEGRPTVVRKGRSPAKHLWGTSWRQEGRTVIEVPSSATVFDLADDGSTAKIYLTETSQYHISDFLREVFWELAVVGGAGTFVHAAAVGNGRMAVAFVGDKGAGKTTTALDFVDAGADFYSGDVLLTDLESTRVYSYPDYPGVCWGTIRANPRLLSGVLQLGLTPSPDDTDKVLLPHDIYWTSLAVRKAEPPLPLGAIVVADVSADGPARLEPTKPRWDLFAPIQRRGSYPGESWEVFLAAAAGRFARRSASPAAGAPRPNVPWYLRRGLGRLPAEEVVALLDRAAPVLTGRPEAGAGGA